MTSNVTRPMRMSCPTGSAVPKMFLATVWPITATRLRSRSSSAANGRPDASRMRRMRKPSAAIPTTVVDELRPSQ